MAKGIIMSINVSLPVELEHWVADLVGSGAYQSTSDVMQEALLVFRKHEQLCQFRAGELRQKLKKGLNQLENGNCRNFSDDVVRQIKANGRKKLVVESI